MVMQKVIAKLWAILYFLFALRAWGCRKCLFCASRLGLVKNVHQGAINFHELFFSNFHE